MPLLALGLYVAGMSAGMARLEEIGRSRAWRASVWLRRLLYACFPGAILVVFLGVKFGLSISVVGAPLCAAALAGRYWHLPLQRAGVRIDSEGRWRSKTWYIVSPYLRRQHRRDVFWLPRR
jgi:hypothetical protein